MGTRMLQRRGTAAEWAAGNPVLADGEIGYERDTRVLKIGDGATAWTALPSAWQTILPINAGSVGLTVQGRPGQAGDLQDWKDNAGAVKAWVGAAGDIGSVGSIQARGYSTHGTSIRFGGTGTATVSISTVAAGNEAIAIRVVAAQTADPIAVKDVTGAIQLARVTASGGFHGHFADGSATTIMPGSSNTMSQGATNNIGLLVKRFAAAVSDVFSVVDENNNQFFGVAASGTVWARQVGTGTTPLVIKAVAGTTVDIVQIQDSTSAAVAKFTSNGSLVINNTAPRNAIGNAGVLGSTVLAISAGSADGTGTTLLTLRGKTGQSAEYQLWQDGTGAAVLAVDKGGHLCGRGTAPLVAAGPALGTTPPAIVVSGTDQSGLIQFGTGTAPAAAPATVLTVTFARPYATAPRIVLTAGSGSTIPINLYVPFNNVTANGFNINCNTTLAASQVANTYNVYYQVIGN